nr:hypothetical protein [uncultured Dysosmobacter sp.]
MEHKLSITEKYTLLMLNGGSSRTDFMACQFTAGIVLGGLFELLQYRCVSVGRGNKLSANRETRTVNRCWATLYNNICSCSAKSMSGWLEHYCFGTTYKNVQPVVDDVLDALSDKGYINISWRRGFFRKKRSITINTALSVPIIDEFVEGVQAGQKSDELVFCTEMLLLADVFKSYFPMGKRWSIKSTLNDYKHSGVWNMMEPYADAVRNFNYQNTVYTGASE